MRGWRRFRQPAVDWSASDPDDVLVRAARTDKRAFAPLYLRYRDDVQRYCFHCFGDWQETQDATQQIFLSALHGLQQLEGRGSGFKGWLMRIAHNEVCDRLKERQLRGCGTLDETVELPDPFPLPEHLVLIRDDLEFLYLLLQRLPKRQRQICELRFSGVTNKEIADLLTISEGAVRTGFAHATVQLRDLMGVRLTRKGGDRV